MLPIFLSQSTGFYTPASHNSPPYSIIEANTQIKDRLTISKLNLKKLFPFELDDFQKQAIAALDRGKSVVVCAPTGSGKTLIGEYAIYRALHQKKRVLYTTPLKALSNQKLRDFREKFGSPKLVGLITGDEVENPEAPIVVMTTEVFRNMLYETPIGQVGTSLENVAAVVLDECHYISEPSRGTVWEESIIYCPPTIQLVALSATIGNPEQLTDWINQVRQAAQQKKQSGTIKHCELINSDFRPVPLEFHFSNTHGWFPLLDKSQKLNRQLKPKRKGGNKYGPTKREDCPTMVQILKQLTEQELLPAIYLIFSRRGCDQAVEQLKSNLVTSQEQKRIQVKLLQFFLADNPDLRAKLLTYYAQNKELQGKLLGFLANNTEDIRELLQYLEENGKYRADLWQFLIAHGEGARAGQIEPLMRGIAAHHAGILPAWKKLVEELFEMGLVKVVFATATLAAGINMPARTTVISALSKRTDDGHRMLAPSEFLQIAGRAGRRGMDTVGHVVTIQSRFDGAKEAARLATEAPEPLKSCFTANYGMVLNLLQNHTIETIKNLLERSFAEYLALQRLAPEQQAMAELTTEITKIDIELAPIQVKYFASYEKLRGRLKEEMRVLEILEQQAETAHKRQIAPQLTALDSGNIIYLKGKHVRVGSPLAALLFTKVPGPGKAPELVCLGSDNRWYVASNADVVDINPKVLPPEEMTQLSVPFADNLRLGKWRKGDSSSGAISRKILDYGTPIEQAPEVATQQQRVDKLQEQLANHPLVEHKVAYAMKRHKQRLDLQKQLHGAQDKCKEHQSSRSYYWEEFLNLIEVLRELGALDEFTPTSLGETAAVVRTENELWLALVLMSGELEELEPFHLAAVISAIITETPRRDNWTEYRRSKEVLEVLKRLKKPRKQLLKTQDKCGKVGFPVYMEEDFVGLVETWALGKEFGVEWGELCQNTSLDEGDIVRILRRTIDVLLQIPQIPWISTTLMEKAKEASANMKRFPV